MLLLSRRPRGMREITLARHNFSVSPLRTIHRSIHNVEVNRNIQCSLKLDVKFKAMMVQISELDAVQFAPSFMAFELRNQPQDGDSDSSTRVQNICPLCFLPPSSNVPALSKVSRRAVSSNGSLFGFYQGSSSSFVYGGAS